MFCVPLVKVRVSLGGAFHHLTKALFLHAVVCYNAGVMKKLWMLGLSLWMLVQCAQVPSDAPAACMPAGWCYVDEIAPQVRVDLKYCGNDNFVGRPIAGYAGGSRAILRRDTAEALARASAILCPQGYALLVWDAYRPAMAMQDFRAWSRTKDEKMKSKFYPNITKQGIYDGKYIGDTSEHSWGIAVDITLVNLKDGKEVDMGGNHDLLDVSSATESPLVSEQQRRNRLILRDAMVKAGFRNYSKEWWHYFLADSAPYFSYSFPLDDHLPPYPMH